MGGSRVSLRGKKTCVCCKHEKQVLITALILFGVPLKNKILGHYGFMIYIPDSIRDQLQHVDVFADH